MMSWSFLSTLLKVSKDRNMNLLNLSLRCWKYQRKLHSCNIGRLNGCRFLSSSHMRLQDNEFDGLQISHLESEYHEEFGYEDYASLSSIYVADTYDDKIELPSNLPKFLTNLHVPDFNKTCKLFYMETKKNIFKQIFKEHFFGKHKCQFDHILHSQCHLLYVV